MNPIFRPALALLFSTASATLLTACDYKYSPGLNTQFKEGFTGTPTYTNADVNRDSVNYKQNVHTPIGKGSATDTKNGTVDDQLNSAPAGKSSATPQDASGKMGAVGNAQPNGSASKAGPE